MRLSSTEPESAVSSPPTWGAHGARQPSCALASSIQPAGALQTGSSAGGAWDQQAEDPAVKRGDNGQLRARAVGAKASRPPFVRMGLISAAQ